ncbi:MAG: ABC transporter permease [Microbacteriaceae bacterium]
MNLQSTLPGAPVRADDPGPVSERRAAAAPSRSGLRRILGHEQVGIVVVLVVIVGLIGAFHPNFLSANSLLGLVRSAAFVAIVAFGMVFLIAMRELDLSVGAIFGLSTLLSAQLMAAGMPGWLGLLAGPAIGVLLGAVNAYFSNTFQIPVIIVTLGTLTLFRGIAVVESGSQAVSGLPISDSFFTVMGNSIFGVPVSVIAVVLIGIILTVVFTRTPFGARVRAIGSNESAARFSGIRVGRTRTQVLMLVGGLCGLSGVLSLAYFQGADATVGTGLELQVIAAAIIGGTAISGGTGSVPGALVGALVIAAISSGLVYFSIGPSWSGVVTGATVLIAVSADGALRRRRALRLARAGG